MISIKTVSLGLHCDYYVQVQSRTIYVSFQYILTHSQCPVTVSATSQSVSRSGLVFINGKCVSSGNGQLIYFLQVYNPLGSESFFLSRRPFWNDGSFLGFELNYHEPNYYQYNGDYIGNNQVRDNRVQNLRNSNSSQLTFTSKRTTGSSFETSVSRNDSVYISCPN